MRSGASTPRGSVVRGNSTIEPAPEPGSEPGSGSVTPQTGRGTPGRGAPAINGRQQSVEAANVRLQMRAVLWNGKQPSCVLHKCCTYEETGAWVVDKSGGRRAFHIMY